MQALAGAKNHMVVLQDADLDVAADAAVSAAFGSAGERCMAVSVLVTVGGIADPLLDAIRDRMTRLIVGDGTDPDSEMGPLVSAEHRGRVADYIAQGASAGASGAGRWPGPGIQQQRLLPCSDPDRPRHHGYVRVHRRDLWSGAQRRSHRLVR